MKKQTLFKKLISSKGALIGSLLYTVVGAILLSFELNIDALKILYYPTWLVINSLAGSAEFGMIATVGIITTALVGFFAGYFIETKFFNK